ncbi:hypothetical protein [Bacteroides sp. 51]|uniref:hypothetical protein n=1 Tax=Bacteroides sp. 51 TaxID=2302938 RepID=UPI0013D3289F|nr:hypothetical protein [Bacteroides sp. 51]NDV83755.1 hypothetical protein [Bacteroides sp. 51]
MLKDNLFSLSRFMDLCRKDMVESWKTNLLRVGMMFGVMVVIFVWSGYYHYKSQYSYDEQVEVSLYTFLWMGLICGCLAASFTMERMKSKTSRLSVLMTPATSFEKFFSRWLISTLVYVVVFIIAFKLADYTRVLLYSLSYPEKNVVAADFGYLFATDGEYALFPHTTCRAKGLFIVGYFFVQSCFVLGSSIWPKNSFIKTFVAGFTLMTAYALIIGGISEMLFKNTSSRNMPNPDFDPEEFITTLMYIVGIFFILLNWGLAYFRFKESEIINRL